MQVVLSNGTLWLIEDEALWVSQRNSADPEYEIFASAIHAFKRYESLIIAYARRNGLTQRLILLQTGAC